MSKSHNTLRNVVGANAPPPSLHPACSALVLDSEWTYNRTGETMRVLYWEKGEVFFRKVRGPDGLVGQTFRLDYERFLAAYTPNDQAEAQCPGKKEPNETKSN